MWFDRKQSWLHTRMRRVSVLRKATHAKAYQNLFSPQKTWPELDETVRYTVDTMLNMLLGYSLWHHWSNITKIRKPMGLRVERFFSGSNLQCWLVWQWYNWTSSSVCPGNIAVSSEHTRRLTSLWNQSCQECSHHFSGGPCFHVSRVCQNGILRCMALLKFLCDRVCQLANGSYYTLLRELRSNWVVGHRTQPPQGVVHFWKPKTIHGKLLNLRHKSGIVPNEGLIR